jgi:hypothetical protein
MLNADLQVVRAGDVRDGASERVPIGIRSSRPKAARNSAKTDSIASTETPNERLLAAAMPNRTTLQSEQLGYVKIAWNKSPMMSAYRDGGVTSRNES